MRKIASRKNRLPEWLRQNIPDRQILKKLDSLRKQGINTVCLEARCPNWSRCLKANTLAFIILGRCCTRNCQFCAVEKLKGKPPPLDKEEPYRILKLIKELQLNFVIITSVTRDDLSDQGSGQFSQTIYLIRNYKRDIGIELLIPDFRGVALVRVVAAQPDVLAHNLETVPRLYLKIRRQARYQRSLRVLAEAKKLNPNLITKSSLLLGMGEKAGEVIQVMEDLLSVGCDMLVLGQYLAPTPRHYPVKEFIPLEQFQSYRATALNLGFKVVVSWPLARTSYQAPEAYYRLKRIAQSG